MRGPLADRPEGTIIRAEMQRHRNAKSEGLVGRAQERIIGHRRLGRAHGLKTTGGLRIPRLSDLKVKLFNRTVSEPYTPAGIFVIDEWRKIGVATEHVSVALAPAS